MASISNCYSTGTVIARATVTGYIDNSAGGLVGDNITLSNATASITNCYSTDYNGIVWDGIGCLVGSNIGGNISAPIILARFMALAW